jgi:hypothetical protein
MAPHGVDLSVTKPRILGVLFRAQMRLGGKDTENTTDADEIMLNYSTDGSEHQALKHDVLFSHMTSSDNWFNAYYDATEDRKWTWDDISNLAVKVVAKARGTVSTDLMSSLVCTVKYYVPSGASPWFIAEVTDPACDTLTLNTATFRPGSPLLNSDPVDLHVNIAQCEPTPVPTPTDTPVPIEIAVVPTATHTPAPGQPPTVFKIHPTLNSVDPEPFNYAGCFVNFTIKTDADVALNVYDTDSGKAVREIKAVSFRRGDNQLFFNAQDYEGHMLRPGAYLFELVATRDAFKETASGTFHFVKK